jgi:glucosamine 6-phosphate synthetase-like amidotransferase/phosphosugar isomerase protein
LRLLSGNLKKTLQECTDFSTKAVARLMETISLGKAKHVYVMGSPGLGEIAAKEGALKIKELTYIHC